MAENYILFFLILGLAVLGVLTAFLRIERFKKQEKSLQQASKDLGALREKDVLEYDGVPIVVDNEPVYNPMSDVNEFDTSVSTHVETHLTFHIRRKVFAPDPGAYEDVFAVSKASAEILSILPESVRALHLHRPGITLDLDKGRLRALHDGIVTDDDLLKDMITLVASCAKAVTGC